MAIHRISEARPVQVPSTGPKRYFSNYAPARSSAEEKRTIAWPQWHRPQTSRRIAPFAVSPVLESRESRELIREEVNFERVSLFWKLAAKVNLDGMTGEDGGYWVMASVFEVY